jgi:CheY-like chemotaxis protein
MSEQTAQPCVLILEDEASILDVMRELLELEGMEVLTASYPEEALERVDTTRPDLFLIDVMLRGASGIEVAVRLRQGAFPSTPMVAMSASPLMMRFAEESGYFDAYLPKPFDAVVLLQALRSARVQAEARQGQRTPADSSG